LAKDGRAISVSKLSSAISYGKELKTKAIEQ
jgi:hypothetical protein